MRMKHVGVISREQYDNLTGSGVTDGIVYGPRYKYTPFTVLLLCHYTSDVFRKWSAVSLKPEWDTPDELRRRIDALCRSSYMVFGWKSGGKHDKLHKYHNPQLDNLTKGCYALACLAATVLECRWDEEETIRVLELCANIHTWVSFFVGFEAITDGELNKYEKVVAKLVAYFVARTENRVFKNPHTVYECLTTAITDFIVNCESVSRDRIAELAKLATFCSLYFWSKESRI